MYNYLEILFNTCSINYECCVAPGTPLSSTTRPRSTCHVAIATSSYQVPSPSPLSCSRHSPFPLPLSSSPPHRLRPQPIVLLVPCSRFSVPCSRFPFPIGLGPSLLPSRFPVLRSVFSVASPNPLTQ